jgi:hypothetical protein
MMVVVGLKTPFNTQKAIKTRQNHHSIDTGPHFFPFFLEKPKGVAATQSSGMEFYLVGKGTEIQDKLFVGN